MLGGRRIGFATIAVTVLTLVLVVFDFTDDAFRGWFAARPFTTATAAGILVLGITVLVVDQVLRMRQLRERSRATAAQAEIVLVQATRATQAASDALNGSGDRATASSKPLSRDRSGVRPGVVESTLTVTAYPTMGSRWATRQRRRRSA